MGNKLLSVKTCTDLEIPDQSAIGRYYFLTPELKFLEFRGTNKNVLLYNI